MGRVVVVVREASRLLCQSRVLNRMRASGEPLEPIRVEMENHESTHRNKCKYGIHDESGNNTLDPSLFVNKQKGPLLCHDDGSRLVPLNMEH